MFPRFRILHLIWATAIAAVLVRIYVISPYLVIGPIVVFGLNGLWLPILIVGLSFFGNKQQEESPGDDSMPDENRFAQRPLIRWLVQGWMVSVLVMILFFLLLVLVV